VDCDDIGRVNEYKFLEYAKLNGYEIKPSYPYGYRILLEGEPSLEVYKNKKEALIEICRMLDIEKLGFDLESITALNLPKKRKRTK